MGEFLWGIRLERQLGRIMLGDADRKRENRKQMTDPALKFNTKLRNNYSFWMMSAYSECGISSKNSIKIQKLLFWLPRV